MSLRLKIWYKSFDVNSCRHLTPTSGTLIRVCKIDSFPPKILSFGGGVSFKLDGNTRLIFAISKMKPHLIEIVLRNDKISILEFA